MPAESYFNHLKNSDFLKALNIGLDDPPFKSENSELKVFSPSPKIFAGFYLLFDIGCSLKVEIFTC
jgi:hypothetical protein